MTQKSSTGPPEARARMRGKPALGVDFLTDSPLSFFMTGVIRSWLSGMGFRIPVSAVLLLVCCLNFASSFHVKLPLATLPTLRPAERSYVPRRLNSFNKELLGPAFGVNSCLAVTGLALKQKALTSEGLTHAWGLGVLLWSTLGAGGWLVCVLYLVFGSLVTKIKMKEKEVSWKGAVAAK